jgi:hypothetical protein
MAKTPAVEAREIKSFRLHRAVITWIERVAKRLNRSEAFVVESACHNMGRDEMPTDFYPGMKTKDEEGQHD